MGADKDNTKGYRRPDHARRRARNMECRQPQSNAMRDRESSNNPEQPSDGAAEKEQTDNEKNMIRTDEDVMDTFQQKLPNDCKSILVFPGRVGNVGVRDRRCPESAR